MQKSGKKLSKVFALLFLFAASVFAQRAVRVDNTSNALLDPPAATFYAANPALSGILGVATGGTGANTLTGILKGNGTSPITPITSSTIGQIFQVTGASNSYGFGALNLATAASITGRLPYANFQQGNGLSVLGVSGVSTADHASINSSSDNTVFRRTGSTLNWGAVDVTTMLTGRLPYANFQQGSALSVLGVTGNATADQAPIAAASDGQVMRRSGTALAFGAVNLASANAITGTLPIANGGTGVTSPGASGNSLISNGTIFVSQAPSVKLLQAKETGYDTASTAEETAWTFTIPANTLATNQNAIFFTFAGKLNGNGNTKTIRVKIGSLTLFDSGAITNSAAADSYLVTGSIMRYVNNVAIGSAVLDAGKSTTTIPTRVSVIDISAGTGFGDWGSSVTFTVTFQSSGSTPGDVHLQYGHLQYGAN